MRKKNALVTLFFLLGGWVCHSQGLSEENITEEVYLHANGTEFITGETLYFSAYVRSTLTGKLSSLSRILYLEILDRESKPVYQTKIAINNGRGYGDYFVSSLLSTGNYHLVAYTRWMKNFKEYFHLPITIINPFEPYKPQVVNNNPEIRLDFYPEGGALLIGKENTVAIKAQDNNGRGIAVSGRVVNTEGDKAISFATNADGLGKIQLIPEIQDQYKAIVENSANEFLFFNLPESCDECVLLKVDDKEETRFEFRIEGNNRGQYRLTISNQQALVYELPVRPGTAYSVFKKELPQGVLQVTLLDYQGMPVGNRLIFNDLNTAYVTSTEEAKIYGPREMVAWQLSVDAKSKVSISIRKYREEEYSADLPTFQLITSRLKDSYLLRSSNLYTSINDVLLVSEWRWEELKKRDSVRFLPEYRFDLLEGRAYTQSNKPVSRACISLALPKPIPQIRLTETDELGKFIFSMDAPEGDRHGFLKVLGKDEEPYQFRLVNEFLDTYPIFENYTLPLDSAKVADIVGRSIHNQIENAFYQFRPDSIIPNADTTQQFEYSSVYHLDDYTRFPTLRDTFIEYIPEIAVKKNENNFDLRFRLLDVPPIGFEPGEVELLLIDGIPVTKKQLLSYSPYNVKTIALINKRFQFGPVVSEGIMSLTTFGENPTTFSAPLFSFMYKGVQSKKKYTFPDYSGNHQSVLPDTREQLYWDPEVIPERNDLLIEFFTSDIPGRYEIKVEGVSQEGKPVSLREYFEVTEKRSNP